VLFVVVPSAAPMRTLTPVLAIDTLVKLVVFNEKARVFTLCEITGAQRAFLCMNPMLIASMFSILALSETGRTTGIAAS